MNDDGSTKSDTRATASSDSNAAASALMARHIAAARGAAHPLANLSTADKAAALTRMADGIRMGMSDILAANARDMADGAARGLSGAMLDRLLLNAARVTAMADAVVAIAALPDPVGQVIDTASRPNGLSLTRVRVPIGVIGMIYESRPNVTADAAALAVMAGNAIILRGGSEAIHSNRAIHDAMTIAMRDSAVPAAAIQFVDHPDRALVGAMLTAAGGIDVIIPRGGKSLVARVQAEARVPVLAHLDGLCHSFVHRAADPMMTEAIILNAKMRRPGVCGATETVLIDQDYPAPAPLIAALLDAGCEVRGDAAALECDARVIPATDADWDSEYLAPIVNVGFVDGLAGALAHIARHSSGHTDAIITADQATADHFLAAVDSAIVMWNASTQFADGGEFGLGAEIGIATGRLHARGPVALEGLTTYKWVVRGTGQTRP